MLKSVSGHQQAVLECKNTDNVRVNVTMRRVRETVVTLEKR